MSRLFLMSGPSGSGKTTFAKGFAKENGLLYLCPDDFYGLFHGDDRIHEDEFDVWLSLWRAIHLAEVHGRDCIVDTNSPTRVDRDQFLNWFGDFTEHHMIYVDAPAQICLNNNASRRRVIPDDEMYRILSRMERPQIYEDSRWDTVTVLINDGNAGYTFNTLRGYMRDVRRYVSV